MPADLPITETTVVEFLKRFEAASATELFDNVAGMIHPHALFRFNDGDYRGLEAIQRAFESTWAQDVKDERYYLSDIEVLNVDARSARSSVSFQLVGRGAERAISHHGSWYQPSRSARWQPQGHAGAPEPLNHAPPRASPNLTGFFYGPATPTITGFRSSYDTCST